MSNLPAAKEKLRKFGELFTTKKDIFAQVLPQHMRPERLIKVALMAMNRQPLLLQCTQASLFQALLAAASLGLEPDGVLGSAYLVPYRNNKTGQYEAQLIPGYRGLIDLARRSGQIESIEAHVIREGDKFECGFGLYPTLTHTPVFPGTAEYLDNKHIIGAYAVAKLKDGASQFEVMSRAEIDAIRNRSKAKDSGPWATDYPEMARKTVVRRLVKYLPMSIELSTALEIDNRTEDGTGVIDLIDVDLGTVPEALPEPEQTRTEQVKEHLAGKRGRPRKEDTQGDAGDVDSPVMVTEGQLKTIRELLPKIDTTESEAVEFYGSPLEHLTYHSAERVIADLLEQTAHMKANPPE